MDYKVMIDAFEGPLDLLLHLIKKSNIEITDINIVDITKQYLDYINCMEKLNLDIASEYLTMAAELIEMKSNILLPKPECVDVSSERENLINRLLDYEQYKNMVSIFRNLELDRKNFFTREPEDLKKYDCVSSIHLCNDVSLDDLVDALNKFYSKKEFEKPLNTKVTSKEYSVSLRCEEIKDYIKSRKKIVFTDLFDSCDKSFIVVTFLAILDLVRKSSIIVSQDRNFNQIYIEDVTL
jgi:segregation and condensation protein A